MTEPQTVFGRISARLESFADAIIARSKSRPAAGQPAQGRRSWTWLTANAGHHRLIPVGLCLMLAAAAFVSTMPQASAATRSPQPSNVAVQLAGNGLAAQPSPTGASSASDASALDLTDGSVLNVLGRPMGADTLALMGTYIVQRGDTLGRIANTFGLAVTTIYWANKSSLPDPQFLRLGQKLMIPPIDGLVVVVGKKDTLDSIAARYGVASQDIIDANDLPDAAVSAGETILVPGAETPPLPASIRSMARSASTRSVSRLVWPVPGHTDITQGFGCTGVISEPPYGNCRHYHDAIDIGAPEGSEVVAAAAGTVIYAGWKLAGSDGFGGGLVVWISHDGKLYTTYNHLSAEFVRVGQTVKAGQRIGSVGMTGNATGPHLHFEVWVCYPWTGNTIACARNPLNYTKK